MLIIDNDFKSERNEYRIIVCCYLRCFFSSERRLSTKNDVNVVVQNNAIRNLQWPLWQGAWHERQHHGQ